VFNAEEIMSNANIRLVQGVYEAFARGDMAAVLDKVSGDATWGMMGRPQDIPIAGIHHGKSGVGEFFKTLAETQELTCFEPRTFAAADDTVFVLGHAEWRMHRNGVTGENAWVHVFTIRDGKVTSFRGHWDTGSLAAAYHAGPGLKRAAHG
jgi:ketosteroid isomerase-like protein